MGRHSRRRKYSPRAPRQGFGFGFDFFLAFVIAAVTENVALQAKSGELLEILNDVFLSSLELFLVPWLYLYLSFDLALTLPLPFPFLDEPGIAAATLLNAAVLAFWFCVLACDPSSWLAPLRIAFV